MTQSYGSTATTYVETGYERQAAEDYKPVRCLCGLAKNQLSHFLGCRSEQTSYSEPHSKKLSVEVPKNLSAGRQHADLHPAHTKFISNALETVAIICMTVQARARVNELFSHIRQQAEELRSQEEELRATNEELETQTESLHASENWLKANRIVFEPPT